MFYFVVRVFVNALALGTTVALNPGISVEPLAERQFSLIFIYIVLGIIFGLINAFIRPLILFITGKLVIWSMGLLTLVINGLLFYLISWLAPNILVIESPALLWLILAGAIMGITVMALEAVFGLDSPVIEDERKSKFYWRWLGRLSTGRHNRIVENLRLYQTYNTIRRYGLDIMVDLTPLARFRHFMQRLIYPGKSVVIEKSVQESVRLMLQELGPTYVKLGQMIASRSDMLPPEWLEELSKLQDTVDPFSYEEAQRIIQDELGAPPVELFAIFETQPMAAASMAQIHRAQLFSGEDVVVKVQRPDIEVTVRGDLNVMRDIIGTLERRASWARNMGLSGILDEFANNVTDELDFQYDAYHARRLAANMSSYEFVSVPIVYDKFSSSRVLTMEYKQGVKITDLGALDVADINRTELAEYFLQVMNKQVLLDGFFHADPHPGNILVDIENTQIVFLDLGMMGRLETEKRLALFDIIWSLNDGDARGLAKRLLQLSKQTKDINEEELVAALDRLVGRYVTYSDSTTSLSDVMQETMLLLFEYGLVLDRSLTLAMKSLMQSEEVVHTLDPKLSFIETAVQSIQEAFVDYFENGEVYEKAKNQAMRTAKEVLFYLPTLQKSAAKWIEQFEDGKLTMHIDTGDIGGQIDRFDKGIRQSVRQLVFGLLLVGLLIGSAIVSTVDLKGIPVLKFLSYDIFIIVFIVVAVIGTLYMGVMLWNAWRDRKE